MNRTTHRFAVLALATLGLVRCEPLDTDDGLDGVPEEARLGVATVGPQRVVLAANRKYADAVSFGTDVSIDRLVLYCDGRGGRSGTQSLRGVIYEADASGEPAALVAASAPLVVHAGAAGAWRALVFAAPHTLHTGTYWIGVLAGGAGGVARAAYRAQGMAARVATDAYADGASDPFGAHTTSGLQLSLFANAQPAAPTDADAGGASAPDAGGTSAPDAGGTSAPDPWAYETPALFDATDGSTNYLRTPIPADPVLDPDSAQTIAAMDLDATPPWAAVQGWAVPMYATHNSDPAYNPVLSMQAAWHCGVPAGGMHIPDFAAIEPADFPTGDNWIQTTNVDTGEVSMIWLASKASGSWTGTCSGVFPLHGNGFRPTVGVGTGSGAAISAGMVLIHEMLAGHVDHALYMTSRNVMPTGFRAPAFKTHGTCTGGAAGGCVQMGTRVQLDPAVDCDALPGATAAERIICHTMETWGAYVLDSGGAGPLSNITFQGDDMTDPARAPWRTPGNGARGTRGCAPVGPSCGIWASMGMIGSGDLVHIPWSRLRILSSWNGQ